MKFDLAEEEKEEVDSALGSVKQSSHVVTYVMMSLSTAVGLDYLPLHGGMFCTRGSILYMCGRWCKEGKSQYFQMYNNIRRNNKEAPKIKQKQNINFTSVFIELISLVDNDFIRVTA